MSPTIIQIHEPTSGRGGAILNKNTAIMPPTPPPKNEPRTSLHQENERRYPSASCDIPRRSEVSSSSSPVISSTGTTPAMGASESLPEGGSGSSGIGLFTNVKIVEHR